MKRGDITINIVSIVDLLIMGMLQDSIKRILFNGKKN